MTKPFDTTLKDLLNVFAVDWADWLGPHIGLSAKIEVEPLDVDLSTVQMSADKVFRLRPPDEGILHIEPQASWDGRFPGRLLRYSVLLHDRYGGPVYSVALLLRPEANALDITGVVSRRRHDGHEYHRFEYFVVKVWELHVEPLMASGIGALPLVLLTDEAEGQIGTLVDRIDARLRAEQVPDSSRIFLLTCGFILLGLRYTGIEIQNAYTRVRGMKESSTYQAILEEGRVEGEIKGREEGEIKGRVEGQAIGLLNGEQNSLLMILRDRFGEVPAEVESRIRAVTEAARLQHAILRAIRISSIEDLEL